LQEQLRKVIEENTTQGQQLHQKNEQIAKYKNLEKELSLQRQTSSDAVTKVIFSLQLKLNVDFY
jgi:hypothetical protein